MSATPIFKPFASMANGYLASVPTLFITKTPHSVLPISSKPAMKLLLPFSSSCLPFKKNTSFSSSRRSLIALVAQTSDWARQDGESNVREEDFDWEQQQEGESEDTEAQISDWEGEGEEFSSLTALTSKMAFPKCPWLSLLSIFLAFSPQIQCTTAKHPDLPNNLLRLSCSHARYPNLCIHTLSSVASTAKTPNDLALAAVSVSMNRARNVSAFASKLTHGSNANKRERSALNDCVEQLSDSVDQLVQTMSELRHLRPGTFRWQMSNAETWVSAALTNEDTCLDGFQDVDGSVKKAVRRKIDNVARVTSNALCLINRLAETRGRDP